MPHQPTPPLSVAGAKTGFWSQTTVERRLSEIVASSKSPPQVKQGAVELRMGCEAYVTGTTERQVLAEQTGEVVIPPGQFALLLTEERVTIPLDAIGFLSLKFGLKARGLINVSGFHVDPGFDGWLTYAVYNAGPQTVRMSRGQCAFLLWLASLDESTPNGDAYSPKNNHGRGRIEKIDDELIMNLQGEIASPGALKAQFQELQKEFTSIQLNYKIYITIAGSILVAMLSILGALVVKLVTGNVNHSHPLAYSADGTTSLSESGGPLIVNSATFNIPAQNTTPELTFPPIETSPPQPSDSLEPATHESAAVSASPTTPTHVIPKPNSP